MRISQRNFCGTIIFLLLVIDTLFLYVLVDAKGWGAANHLAVWEKILSEEE